MDLSVNAIKEQIPYYLTQEDKETLVKALKDFESISYYIPLKHKFALQGDGWSALGVIDYETGARKTVRGILLSNTCDIDPRNRRDVPARLIFAPIIKLNAFSTLLRSAGISGENIDNKFKAIRKQRVSTLFYLPKGAGLDDEYIAVLDDIHSIPLSLFYEQRKRAKLFTLSLPGFYLFILKLTIHFCRLRDEGVRRN